MELSKNYIARDVENQWYAHWVNKGYFASTPDDREAYTIVMPPPNVTGILHMGHALNNTVQDILLRHAKLQGKNTCWVPGTDHASIATEAKVVAMLKEKGIDKNRLSREEFLDHAWKWKEKYGGIILEQLKKLGCALDWNRTAFTMDADYYNAVIDVFIDLYNKGYIYRGVKMVNWDPSAKTSLSDEEVIFKETNSKLYYIQYQLADDALAVDKNLTHLTVATVRPETILGDVAICVHPHDERYKHLVGKHCFVPLINREIPIIADEYIDMDFGTGCLKVTPAHDLNDYNLGIKHNLEVIDTLNEDGTMSQSAQLYVGMDRFAVRKKIAEDLETVGNLQKTEEYKNQVGYSERTNAAIEPRLSMQWWCKMEELSKPALEAVMNDDVKFYPPKFKNTYKHWMENIKDWCISRQLWWGHRIPAWYDDANNMVIAKTKEEAFEKLKSKNEYAQLENIRQDDDVLDTWFSSWLWPLEVFGWNKNKTNNNELDYYYPTATLVTAPEIIFFWVARMIVAGYEYRGKKPFEQVYFTGIVRDKQGRKMSKSLGNSPDLLQLIDDYGADGVRFGVLIASPAGNDILFDESSCEQGRNFCNKMWNALKLLKILESKEKNNAPASFASTWFAQRLQEVQIEVAQLFKEFKLSEALKTVYGLIWDDYCAYYLEWIKTAQDASISLQEITIAKKYFEELMKLLHPFMPFVSEEIYHQISEREEGNDLVAQTYSATIVIDKSILEKADLLKKLIVSSRDLRIKNNLKPKDEITLYVANNYKTHLQDVEALVLKQCNAVNILYTDETIANSISFLVNKMQCQFTSNVTIDVEKQHAELQKEIEYLKGFLASVEKKLSNDRFVQNARPDILALENKKKADAEEKLKMLEEKL